MSKSVKTILKITSYGMIALLLLLVFLLAGVRLLGLEIYTVLSPSMEPNYPTGSLIYVKEVDPSTLQEKDVITYRLFEIDQGIEDITYDTTVYTFTVTVPATLLLQGKTRSCGCLKRETIRAVNQYVGGTNLRQTLKDDPKSTRAVSGYVGVTPKRGKWQAYITYHGVRRSLGCYDNLPDAVQARARAKEQVMEAALAFAER